MDAPEELRQAVRVVLADHFPMTPLYRVNRAADAVLAVPAIADAELAGNIMDALVERRLAIGASLDQMDGWLAWEPGSSADFERMGGDPTVSQIQRYARALSLRIDLGSTPEAASTEPPPEEPDRGWKWRIDAEGDLEWSVGLGHDGDTLHDAWIAAGDLDAHGRVIEGLPSVLFHPVPVAALRVAIRKADAFDRIAAVIDRLAADDTMSDFGAVTEIADIISDPAGSEPCRST